VLKVISSRLMRKLKWEFVNNKIKLIIKKILIQKSAFENLNVWDLILNAFK
jgi:hypothetical protein